MLIVKRSQVSVKISDVRLHLTQLQYKRLVALSQSIPRVLAATSEASADAEQSTLVPTPDSVHDSQHPKPGQPPVDLQPELRQSDPEKFTWPSLDLVVSMNVVKLHLYDESAISEMDRKEHGISRFSLNSSSLRFKMLSNGASEAQVVLKSFTMSNTRSGASKFREIIPAAGHDRNQFMVLYTNSGGINPSALVVATIDSPQVIFSIDPVFALADYFMSAFPPTSQPSEGDIQTSETNQNVSSSTLDFRVDLHDLSINVLEDDTMADTRAISLSIRQVLLSQQVLPSFVRHRI